MGDKVITVSCVGDSITYGLTIDDPEDNCYPNQLQLLLGPRYVVNPSLGKCGAGIWHRGTPYSFTEEYRNAIKWPADILIICLGTNDAIYPINDDFKHEFKKDYISLVRQLTKNNLQAKVYLCLVPPIPGLINLSFAITTINELVVEVTKLCNYNLIDLNTPLTSRSELFSDGVHPNEKGAKKIAEIVFETIVKF